ncbi:TPA: restriction endonuclease subunit S [Staphylococcus argenteus]|uniref:restriction endonuclease subunit S n=1 Tax=Staphylococcus argenteus TaxID=985002 RepID=UPI0002340229|nr:restriction endonuclease subunit S [Staphylococcus argenteus]MBE2131457.1 restriction endonuclease subunit S [Staphylococcus argenteus]PNY90857.1 restriction endonuclease subunit S [Staphylococcus argenteus]CCE59497.1 restriction-modification system, S subunit [Staphylococcus argenteus]HDY9429877.1 restriction endonuclease subunit S [Staphylococcus argenteus]HDY9438416.1 restriction endonuclease subunit S [Staphylococcus argenteus]
MSNTGKMNVPELRFPGFEGEWEEKELRELRNPKDKYSYTGGPFGSDLKKSDYTTDGIQIIQLQNIGDGYFYNSNKVFTSNEKAEVLKSCNVFPGDIVIAKMADPIARAAIVPDNNIGKYLMASDGIRLSVDTVHFNTKFVLECINRKSFRKKVEDNSSGSTRMRIGLSTLGSLTLKTTTLKEQQKIGQFFSKLDRQIVLEEQKLELLQQQKKGYMQKIFSQELRFKDENGNDYPDWEEKQLGELSQIVRGASPRPIKDPKWFNKESDIGWLRISDVTNQNGKIYHLEQKLSIEGQEKTRVLVTTHLLLSIAASIGKPVMNFVKTGVHDGFLIFLKPKFNLFFMYYWLEYFKDKWSKYGQPGSQVNLNSEIVKSQTLNMPSNHEQEKVGQFFNRNEKLIELQQEKIMYIKRCKQVLLQKMFI